MSCLQLRWRAREDLWDPWDGCGDGAEWCCGREDYGSGENSGSATEEVASEVHCGGRGFFFLSGEVICGVEAEKWRMARTPLDDFPGHVQIVGYCLGRATNDYREQTLLKPSNNITKASFTNS